MSAFPQTAELAVAGSGASARADTATRPVGGVSRVDRLTAELEQLEPLPFFDPGAAFGPAVALEKAAAGLGAVDLQLRAKLVQADVLCRRGQTAAGGGMVREVHRWAVDHGHRHLLARSHRLQSLFFSYMGDVAASLEHAVQAIELVDEAAPGRLRADYLIALATALSESGAFEQARNRLETAEQIAEALGDIRLRIAVLNTEAWIASDAGENEMALKIAQRMQTVARANGVALQAPELETLARAQLELGFGLEAEQTLQPVLDDTVVSGEGNALAYCLLTLAESQQQRGATGAARITLQRCRQVCAERDLAGIRVMIEEQLAMLYAQEGLFEEAYQQYRLFHRAAEALHSAEQTARAQTAHAMFETTEAKRDSERFEQMALHDPLTGLYNRRFVDDELPILLRRSAETETTISVGLIDIDHFKRINDTFSHQTGDEVLRAVALLLDASKPPGSFVARIGGEEFLMVLPRTGASEAARCFEVVAEAIRSHPWSLSPIERVTVSIGTTTTTTSSGSTQSTVLGQADHNLYRAKRAGRDRVVAGDDRS